MGIIGRLRGRDRAQVLLLTALMVPILLGMTAIAVDVGTYADDKRNLQNAADAIALAAAKDMCTPNPAVCSDTTGALATANSYATKNGVDPSEMTVQFLGGNTAPRVRVTLAHGHDFSFMPVLGIDSKDVSVVAAAVRTSPGGASGIVPFGVTQATLDAAGSGNSVVLKYDASGGTTGNYGAIDIDGNGANVYRADLKFGSPSMVCSVTQTQCVESTCDAGGAFPSACAEDAPSCDGPVCDSEPGNMKGPTQDGVDLRMNHTSAACDTFDEAFAATSITGKYALNPDCNPWGAGGCPVPDAGTALCSRRVIIVPIIDGFGNGRSDFTIQSFALMYLEGYGPNGCSGNDCEIKGRFVKADVSISGLTGTYDPDSSIHMEKLVE